ncbi:Gfo/Idh/MocA family oxidoreductase [Streptomyces misionensis]|uniref:Gfo/Idh/MocA family protein n=1 Tax=Streptomyces misionensis TaxID=67331 RepID=UPI0033E1FCB7
MQTNTLRVGVIGLNVDGAGWAAEGHAPAIRATEGLDLAGVATRSIDSARRAAEYFDIARAYEDPGELITDPAIDIVAVISPVPTHREYIVAAIRAGKHVITEWPVAAGAEQVREVADEAEDARVHHAVNLQARQSPALVRAGRLLAEGVIGRVLSVNVVSTTAGFGARIPAAYLPLERPETWTSLGTIQTAHTLDAVTSLVGPLDDLAAILDIQYPEVVVDGEQTIARTLTDHVVAHGRAASGATVSIEVIGGRPDGDTPFRLEIYGDQGVLTIEGGGPRGFQAGPLALRHDGRQVDLGELPSGDLAPSALNVAHTYRALRDDIRSGGSTVPTLREAADLAGWIERIGASRPVERTTEEEDA